MTATEFPASDVHPTPARPRWRRPLLAALWLVFALWVATLLTMYFATVYPQRHPAVAHPFPVPRSNN